MTSRSGVAQARYIYIYIFVLLHTNVIKKKKNIYILSMSIKGSKPIQEKKC